MFNLINAWTISGSTKYEQYLFKIFLSVVVIKKILIMRLIKVASVVSHVLGSIWCCTLLMGYSHWFVMKSRLALLLSSLLHEICWPQRYYRRETSFKDWIYFFSFIYFLSSYFLTFLNHIPCLYQLGQQNIEYGINIYASSKGLMESHLAQFVTLCCLVSLSQIEVTFVLPRLLLVHSKNVSHICLLSLSTLSCHFSLTSSIYPHCCGCSLCCYFLPVLLE